MLGHLYKCESTFINVSPMWCCNKCWVTFSKCWKHEQIVLWGIECVGRPDRQLASTVSQYRTPVCLEMFLSLHPMLTSTTCMFTCACCGGRLENVHILFPRLDPTHFRNCFRECIVSVMYSGHLDVLKELIEKCEIEDNLSGMAFMACSGLHVETMGYLLDGYVLGTEDMADLHGLACNVGCIRHLLGRNTPQANVSGTRDCSRMLGGTRECRELVVKHGTPVTIHSMDIACSRGDLDTVVWLRREVAPGTSSTFEWHFPQIPPLRWDLEKVQKCCSLCEYPLPLDGIGRNPRDRAHMFRVWKIF